MHQAAALPFRRAGNSGGSFEVLLVTSGSGRWIIPKGDIDEGVEPHLAAEKEAFEEGGVRGCVSDRRIGTFATCKQQDGAAITAEVDVFPLDVSRELDHWPEMTQRERCWLPIDEAADAVGEPELAAIIRKFSP